MRVEELSSTLTDLHERQRMRVLGPSDGQPLVLSNALGTTSELWDPQLPELTRRFRVVLYDHPPRSSVAELADVVLEIVDGLRIQRFALCGISLGAMVGMRLALDCPDRIDGLVLACTSARFGAPEEWDERAALVRAEGMTTVTHDALEKWFTPAFRDRERFLRMQLEFPPENYALGLEAIGAFDVRHRLGSIRAPTVVVAGAEDSATPPADAAFIASRIPHARLVVLEGAAHLANVERPDAFTSVVVEHLRRASRGDRPAPGSGATTTCSRGRGKPTLGDPPG